MSYTLPRGTDPYSPRTTSPYPPGPQGAAIPEKPAQLRGRIPADKNAKECLLGASGQFSKGDNWENNSSSSLISESSETLNPKPITWLMSIHESPTGGLRFDVGV